MSLSSSSSSSSSASSSSTPSPQAVERPDYCRGRHAGVLLPLFSCPSTRSWGIGEIGDLPAVAHWLRAAGLDLLQMLPVNEMAFGQSSPYSALSAMAIDPLFIALADVPEFQALGGEASLSPDMRARLEAVRRSPDVAYADVRALKDEALRASYARFRSSSDAAAGGGAGARRQAFEVFQEEQRWWLEDYALFRALHERHEHRAWWTWDAALRAREAAALDRVRAELADEIRYYEFLQWLASDQWRAARAASAPVGLFGDLPFMVGADSADVWAHQDVFARDLSVGTPPDAFSATGQDWGLPAYRWQAVVATDFHWLRARARRAADLFAGVRIDHVIGFYRTYVRPIPLPDDHGAGGDVTDAQGNHAHGNGTHDHGAHDNGASSSAPSSSQSSPAATPGGGAPFFTPADENDQRMLGERILGLFMESGACLIAEDLGTVPDFVRESLGRLQVPGYRVLRWERDWHADGHPFRHPADYPSRSLATTGTHDTDPLAIWWETAPADERRAVAQLAGLSVSGDSDGQRRDSHGVGNQSAGGNTGADAHAEGTARDEAPFDARLRDAVLRLLYASGSDLLVLPIQDVFGWRDRINTPATVAETNWTWRLPWPVDHLSNEPEARARAEALRAWAAETNRATHLGRP
jgi:4-alpha-glucanotransferase